MFFKTLMSLSYGLQADSDFDFLLHFRYFAFLSLLFRHGIHVVLRIQNIKMFFTKKQLEQYIIFGIIYKYLYSIFLNLKSGTRDQRLNLPPNARWLPGVCVPIVIMNQTFVKRSNEMGFKFGFSYTVLKSSLLILFTIHISQ